MDFMRLLGTVLAVFIHPGYASKLNGQRICRRGTERPCYKILYYQDVWRRLSFEEARQACRSDGVGGELLSIRTENEQRLVERFMQQIHGDFWIGLRRSGSQTADTQGCPSQYYWLDGSQASYRNWHRGEPSCGEGERCVVLRHQPSAPPYEGRRFLFTWSDGDCNHKNNFVCKYSEEKVTAFTVAGNTIHTEKVPAFTVAGSTIHTDAPNLSLRPILPLVTESDETTNIRVSESSVSLSDGGQYMSYILFGTIPLVLLLLLLGATGVFCFRRAAKRRKTETDSYPGGPDPPWLSAGQGSGPAQALYPPIQGPYAYNDVTKLPLSAMGDGGDGGGVSPDSFCPSAPGTLQCEDYENLPSPGTANGFVTNDIYETCRGRGPTGWVENEIYG